ncbi:hypothetical protein [Methylococcus mesophilus]|uniref:hypothetical protein n=1 Tax=Methylococcus mesophilus TaxID=2993564 RepID=UPI0037435A85
MPLQDFAEPPSQIAGENIIHLDDASAETAVVGWLPQGRCFVSGALASKVEDREEPGNDREHTLNGEMNMSAVKPSGSAIPVGIPVRPAVCEAGGPQASGALP